MPSWNMPKRKISYHGWDSTLLTPSMFDKDPEVVTRKGSFQGDFWQSEHISRWSQIGMVSYCVDHSWNSPLKPCLPSIKTTEKDTKKGSNKDWSLKAPSSVLTKDEAATNDAQIIDISNLEEPLSLSPSPSPKLPKRRTKPKTTESYYLLQRKTFRMMKKFFKDQFDAYVK